MNKKVMGIVLAAIVILGGGYYFLMNGQSKNTNAGGEVAVTHRLSTEPVMVKKNPESIAVFDHGLLDVIGTLEGNVTGVVKSNLPASLSQFDTADYEDVGTLFEPNFETLASMKPDVIFISGRQEDQYDELSKIAPTVYFELAQDDYLGSLNGNVTTIGEILGKEIEAEKELKTINDKFASLKKDVEGKKLNALVTLTNDGEISAYGPASRFGLIHQAMGFAPVDPNIESTNHGQTVSFEYILEKNPQYIFVIDRNKAIGQGEDGSKVFENDLMKNVDAYKNGNIVFVDQTAWYLASGGIQSTNLMIDEINAAL